MPIKRHILHAGFGLAFALFSSAVFSQPNAPQTLLFTVFHTYEHDAKNFTQGLAIHGENFYEGSGLYGSSAAFQKDLKTGKTRKMRKNAQQIFGEGVTVLNDKVYQLSWQNHTGFIYDLALKPLREFKYDTEGWGLTNDGEQLILSDGSATLYWLDEKNLAVTRKITVHDGNREIWRLNELEYADGFIYANVWMTDNIAVIDPADGAVRAWLDLSALKKGFIKPPGWNEIEHVLNGIAYEPKSGHFFVTGKCWPVMFELQIEKPAKQ